MNRLTVEHLSLQIGETPILNDISFVVEPGKVLGIVGESGSGKSMTAFSITQLLPPRSQLSGAVSLGSQRLTGMTEAELCTVRGDAIGMIFQEPMTALNPVKTIGDQVAETVRQHLPELKDEADEIANHTLNRVGLPEARFPRDRYPHELSGGQRQRVVIALAIALKPDFVIADEPTTALDVTTQRQVLSILQQLVDEDGTGLILISHDLAVVSNIADDILIMRHGEVVEQGPCDDVFKARSHPYTQQLFEASDHQPQRSQVNDKTSVLLDVKGLVRDYRVPRKHWLAKPGWFRAVNNVDFQVFSGESLGLVGESGCGKSTLTRAVLGLEKLQGGSIELDGQRVDAGKRMPAALRRRMQVVFQDPYGSFNPRHRVARLIAEPFHLLDKRSDIGRADNRKDQVVEALRQVGMQPEDADKYIHEFSGGQRQRIALARAIVIRPSLVILDEAVSALDVSIRAQILDLLVELAENYQLSYLFISHDLSVVRNVTDRVLVMKAGEIVESGETRKVFDNPQHAYTQSLIEAIPRLRFT